MTSLRLLAGALALCLVLPMAAAKAETRCATRAELSAFLAQRLPEVKITVLGPGESQVFLASLAGITKNSEPVADEIVIVDAAPDAPLLKIVLFEHGCLTRIGAMPRRLVTRLLNDVARAGA